MKLLFVVLVKLVLEAVLASSYSSGKVGDKQYICQGYEEFLTEIFAKNDCPEDEKLPRTKILGVIMELLEIEKQSDSLQVPITREGDGENQYICSGFEEDLKAELTKDCPEMYRIPLIFLHKTVTDLIETKDEVRGLHRVRRASWCTHCPYHCSCCRSYWWGRCSCPSRCRCCN